MRLYKRKSGRSLYDEITEIHILPLTSAIQPISIIAFIACAVMRTYRVIAITIIVTWLKLTFIDILRE